MTSRAPVLGAQGQCSRESFADFCVVVPVFFGDHWIDRCVDSLLSVAHLGMRVLLIDNFGNSDMSRFDGRDGLVDVVSVNGPFGYAEVNNLVLPDLVTRFRYICFLNQDTRSDVDWITPCINALDQDSSLGAVTPWILAYEGQCDDCAILECAGGESRDRIAPLFHTAVLPAAALICRSSVLVETGPFDPIFGSYYEDFDLCDRMSRAGYRLGIQASVHVRHESGSATLARDAGSVRRRLVLRNRAIRRVRLASASGGRRRQLARELFFECPRQLVRALLRRTGSGSAISAALAWCELLCLAPRLASESRDRGLWRSYLVRLGWPAHNAMVPESAGKS